MDYIVYMVDDMKITISQDIIDQHLGEIEGLDRALYAEECYSENLLGLLLEIGDMNPELQKLIDTRLKFFASNKNRA